MKAEDIREMNILSQDACTKSATGVSQDVGLRSLQCSLLAEIAAQLAEVNEHLEKITDPLANSLSNLNDDPYRVLGCVPVIINGLEATEITLRNGSKFTTQGRYEDISTKLGIPVSKSW